MIKTFFPERIQANLKEKNDEWRKLGKLKRLWQKDSSLWTKSGEEKWLGWLDVSGLQPEKSPLTNFENVVVLGMGGSSLAPEVLAQTFKHKKGPIYVLDSTDPGQILSVEKEIVKEKTAFLVSSKSGGTLETNLLLDHFYETQIKTNFFAITDPGSSLEKKARDLGFNKIWLGNPEVGGRFSALTPFGTVIGEVTRMDVQKYFDAVKTSLSNFKPDSPLEDNPGLTLGLGLYACLRQGLKYLYLFASPEIESLPNWVEQLIAESTGKKGKGLIPFCRDLGDPFDEKILNQGHVVFMRFKGSGDSKLDQQLKSCRDHGIPVTLIEIDDLHGLSSVFYLWEFATAVLGSEMGINPFDQPDVESTKIETKKIIEKIKGKEERTQPGNEDFKNILRLGKTGDYLSLLAFVERNDTNVRLLRDLRRRIEAKNKWPCAVGFGPRYLHSTGQLYKGGPDIGLYLLITCSPKNDLPLKEGSLTFGRIEGAQALGDLKVLKERGRRVIHLHFKNFEEGLAKLVRDL